MPVLSPRRMRPANCTDPRRYRAFALAWLTAVVVAVAPMAPAPAVRMLGVLLTAQDIVLDIIRHGEDAPPLTVPFSPPGTMGVGLSANGVLEAATTANNLALALGVPGGNLALGYPDAGIAGIFSGPDTDSQATAAPFALLQGLSPTVLPGLIEVDGGWSAGAPVGSLAGTLYGLSSFLWTIGLDTVLPIPGADHYNGLVTADAMSGAIQTIYSTVTGSVDPLVSANGFVTAAAFGSSASTLVWVFNTVENPDLPVLLKGLLSPNSDGVPQPLPNAGVVELQGNPTDGWTLVNWAGTDVPDEDNMGFMGDLFKLWREIVLPPQVELDNVFQALLTGDLTTIWTALQNGIENEFAALAQLPGLAWNVIEDFPAEVQSIFTFFGDVMAGESITDALLATIFAL